MCDGGLGAGRGRAPPPVPCLAQRCCSRGLKLPAPSSTASSSPALGPETRCNPGPPCQAAAASSADSRGHVCPVTSRSARAPRAAPPLCAERDALAPASLLDSLSVPVCPFAPPRRPYTEEAGAEPPDAQAAGGLGVTWGLCGARVTGGQGPALPARWAWPAASSLTAVRFCPRSTCS